MSQYSTRYNPKARVIIKDLRTGKPTIGDISDDLISLTTNKAYGRSAGTWQMMLSYRLVELDGSVGRYHEIIFPGDVITIEIDAGAGKGFQPVMLGLVDRVSKTRAEGPTPNRQVKVSGQDMGKLLDKCDIGWDISGGDGTTAEDTIDKMFGSIERRLPLESGTPGELFSKIASIFYKSCQSAANYISFYASTEDSWKLFNPAFSVIKNVSVWQALKTCSHECWNMLHTETISVGDGEDEFQVLLEQMPIDSEGMVNRGAKDTHIIGDEEIKADDVGVSDAERINLLCYWPTMQQIMVEKILEIAIANKQLTSVDKQSIDDHGYLPKIIYDSFMPPALPRENATKIYGQMVSQIFTELTPAIQPSSPSVFVAPQPPPLKENPYELLKRYFWGWYSENHKLAAGTIQIHGRPEIKCGSRLLVEDESGPEYYMEYLIEQVSHQFQVWPTPMCTTTLHVTRGQLITEGMSPADEPQPTTTTAAKPASALPTPKTSKPTTSMPMTPQKTEISEPVPTKQRQDRPDPPAPPPTPPPSEPLTYEQRMAKVKKPVEPAVPPPKYSVPWALPQLHALAIKFFENNAAAKDIPAASAGTFVEYMTMVESLGYGINYDGVGKYATDTAAYNAEWDHYHNSNPKEHFYFTQNNLAREIIRKKLAWDSMSDPYRDNFNEKTVQKEAIVAATVTRATSKWAACCAAKGGQP